MTPQEIEDEQRREIDGGMRLAGCMTVLAAAAAIAILVLLAYYTRG